MEIRAYCFWKRLMDIVLSMVLLPPFLALGLIIVLISFPAFRSRLFYTQQRLGYRNKVFRIYKFTTLLPEQQNGRECSLDERQTRWGSFMRNYSLDELPQLLNILKGNMSFVGPRPLLPEYESLYSPAEARRHLVKPGLSGLAQVNGRNALSWEEKMQFDQQYVEAFSFRQDLQIIYKTLGVILKGQEVNYGAAPVQLEVYIEPSRQSAHAAAPMPEIKWKQA